MIPVFDPTQPDSDTAAKNIFLNYVALNCPDGNMIVLRANESYRVFVDPTVYGFKVSHTIIQRRRNEESKYSDSYCFEIIPAEPKLYGAGSFGKVYESAGVLSVNSNDYSIAYKPTPGKRVIKEVMLHSDEKLLLELDGLHKEYELGKHTDHLKPKPPTLSVLPDQNTGYLAMANLGQTTLHDKLSDTPSLTIQQRFNLAKQFADQVRFLHAQGIVHHDLKPKNCTISPTGQLHLIDMGLSQIEGELNRVLGTIRYAAPEVFNKEIDKIDTLFDIYSAGIVIAEIMGRCLIDNRFTLPEYMGCRTINYKIVFEDSTNIPFSNDSDTNQYLEYLFDKMIRCMTQKDTRDYRMPMTEVLHLLDLMIRFQDKSTLETLNELIAARQLMDKRLGNPNANMDHIYETKLWIALNPVIDINSSQTPGVAVAPFGVAYPSLPATMGGLTEVQADVALDVVLIDDVALVGGAKLSEDPPSEHVQSIVPVPADTEPSQMGLGISATLPVITWSPSLQSTLGLFGGVPEPIAAPVALETVQDVLVEHQQTMSPQ